MPSPAELRSSSSVTSPMPPTWRSASSVSRRAARGPRQRSLRRRWPGNPAPRECHGRAASSATPCSASWLLAAHDRPQRSSGTSSAVTCPPSAAGTSRSVSAVKAVAGRAPLGAQLPGQHTSTLVHIGHGQPGPVPGQHLGQLVPTWPSPIRVTRWSRTELCPSSSRNTAPMAARTPAAV